MRKRRDRDIRTPFNELQPPGFEMQQDWTLADLVGYLHTWSAVRRYRDETGEDPLASIQSGLEKSWGDPGSTRPVRWPLVLRVCRR